MANTLPAGFRPAPSKPIRRMNPVVAHNPAKGTTIRGTGVKITQQNVTSHLRKVIGQHG